MVAMERFLDWVNSWMASGSDKLFQRNKAKREEDYSRREATLFDRDRVFILYEGYKTEPIIFSHSNQIWLSNC